MPADIPGSITAVFIPLYAVWESNGHLVVATTDRTDAQKALRPGDRIVVVKTFIPSEQVAGRISGVDV